MRIALVVGLLCWACTEDRENSGQVDLSRAVFLHSSDVAELTVVRGAESRQYDVWQPRLARRLEGWGPRRRGWQPVGSSAALLLKRRLPDREELFLEIRRRSSSSGELTMLLEVNGRSLATLSLEEGVQQLRIPVPSDLLQKINRVDLGFDPPLGGPGESGAPVVQVRRAGWLVPGSAVPEASEIWTPSSSDRVRAPADGQLLVPVRVPDAATVLRFVVVGSPGTTAEISMMDREGELRPVEEGRLEIDGEREVEVPVTDYRGSTAFLVVEASDRSIELSVARWDAAADSVTAGSSPSAVSKPLPDVIMILLDAARADRFAASDPGRPTSPRIDELADEARVYRKAYSECANTSCSIPNLVTGLPFLTGPTRGTRLSEEATTLAERFRDAGYRTVGLSANPYNSETWGLTQGFDQWVDMGSVVEDAYEPLAISRLAAELHADQPSDRPLYLQLHYLPPHNPYEPTERFDLFTDPGYSGPVRPDIVTRPYNAGEKVLSPEDLAHLIGLYDGTALRADHAVGELLDFLRTSGRWDRTVVLLTSDHGEALGEHGYIGHSATLFDETLHIPFVLRIPGDPARGTTLDHFVHLTDVAPTLSALAGLDESGLPGANLLEAGEGMAERVIFARTGTPTFPWLSARTARWKLIVDTDSSTQMLFDLEADPGETRNLAMERPLLAAALGLLIRDQIVEGASWGLAGEIVAVPEAEQRQLRALGYLE